MRALFLLLALVLGLGETLRAEEPASGPEPGAEIEALRQEQILRVRALLTSIDARQRAWGATWARTLGLTELTPELLEVVRLQARTQPGAASPVVLAAFDALIQLDARLEANLLEPFLTAGFNARRSRGGGVPGSTPAATILAVRSGELDTQRAAFAALDASDGSPGLPWLALGNALDADPAADDFVARLMARLDVRLQVWVVDHDIVRGRCGGSFGSACGTRFVVSAGYPPIWTYRLTRHPVAGDVLLADGPTPIFCQRRPLVGGLASGRAEQARMESRLAWIARRLEVDVHELPVVQKRWVRSRWTTGDALLRDIESAKVEVRAAFRTLAAELVAKGATTEPETRSLTPGFELELIDDRDDRSEPLPLPSAPGPAR